MDEKKKKELIKALSVAKNFHRTYSAENRRWFVDRLIRTFVARGQTDSQVEASIRGVIQKTAVIIENKKNFKSKLSPGSDNRKKERGLKKRRVEIVCGAIASDPEFADSAQADYLDFIIRRRYRPILRMNFFVNPNSLGYFRYPHTCAGNKDWRVNKDAGPLWKRFDSQKQVPIIMKDDSVNKVTAIQKIFIRKGKACDGNLFDCATTLSILFMDSLFEARQPGDLFDAIQSDDRTYLAIVHVGFGAHFVSDNTQMGLFLQQETLVEDLQVGDHVYIYNHPLYKVFHPVGDWRGEHSLVVDCGNRKVDSRKGFRFTGHGLTLAGGSHEGTVFDFYSGMFKELQTDLSRTFEIGKLFLAHLKSGETKIPASKVTKQDATLKVNGSPLDFTLFQIKQTVSYRDFERTPTGSRRSPRKEVKQFVIAKLRNVEGFYICRESTNAKVIARPDLLDPTGGTTAVAPPLLMFDGTPMSDPFDPIKWVLFFRDPTTNQNEKFALFKAEGGKVVMRLLEIKDLLKSPFAKVDPTNEKIFTTRPRVDFSSAYQDNLTDAGAL